MPQRAQKNGLRQKWLLIQPQFVFLSHTHAKLTMLLLCSLNAPIPKLSRQIINLAPELKNR
jgi:hypothetical protein